LREQREGLGYSNKTPPYPQKVSTVVQYNDIENYTTYMDPSSGMLLYGLMQTQSQGCGPTSILILIINRFLRSNSDKLELLHTVILPAIIPLRDFLETQIQLGGVSAIDMLKSLESPSCPFKGIFKVDSLENWTRMHLRPMCISLVFDNYDSNHWSCYIPVTSPDICYLIDPLSSHIFRATITNITEHVSTDPLLSSVIMFNGDNIDKLLDTIIKHTFDPNWMDTSLSIVEEEGVEDEEEGGKPPVNLRRAFYGVEDFKKIYGEGSIGGYKKVTKRKSRRKSRRKARRKSRRKTRRKKTRRRKTRRKKTRFTNKI
jgi:hypothetical protein